jgi:MFS family permease
MIFASTFESSKSASSAGTIHSQNLSLYPCHCHWLQQQLPSLILSLYSKFVTMSSGNIEINGTEEGDNTKLDRSVVCSLAVLSLVGLIDAISYMAVAPSLIFYVNNLGGTKEQYGIIMSAFSFASFCFKPVYGRWVDASGNKYKIPFAVSFAAAMVGNLVYFAAILMPHGVYGLLVGRLLAGMGAANNALGYSYIATVLPPDKQTTINVFLSMTRILGMTLGPFVNLFLGEIDTVIHIGNSFTIPLDPYNSVGLFVALGQLLVLIIALLFFNEPLAKEEENKNSIVSAATAKAGMKELWEAVSRVEIVVPLIIIFVVNCNFQL